MPTLPPYSTFRTDSKQMLYPQATSHGNVLTFTPPGLKQQLNVKFPDSRLAVCFKCKKNFKTRDMCRVRNCHTAAPWTTSYICITVDDSCLDENGKFIDKPLTLRMVQWQPFITKKLFDPKSPVCSACKRTNRTRTFCRDKHKHRHLPWCTVYVVLTALDQTDPNTVVAAPSQKVDSDTEDSVAGGSKTNKDEASVAGSSTIGSEYDGDSDDINEIAESRTFLVKVSSQGTSIHWLDLAEYDAINGGEGYAPGSTAEMPPHPHYPGMPNEPPVAYYPHGMDYAAVQHQNALKSHQQYFFQMQQQRHHQYHSPGAWPHVQDPNVAVGNGDGDTATKRSASKRGQSQDEAYHAMHYQQQQQWALYLGHNYPQDAPPPQSPGDENTDRQQLDSNGDSDDVETKRRRVE